MQRPPCQAGSWGHRGCAACQGTGKEVSRAAWPPSSPNHPALPGVVLSLLMVEPPPGLALDPARSRTCSGHPREKSKNSSSEPYAARASPHAGPSLPRHPVRRASVKLHLLLLKSSLDSGRDLPLMGWKRQPGCPAWWGLSCIGVLP